MEVPVREWTHWAVGYGVLRPLWKLQARRGDPLSQLVRIDINPAIDIYPLIEEIRAGGRMRRIAMTGWVTADAQIVRDVLRDIRFRTIKQRDRSPFRIVQWILAKTDPGVLSPIEPPSMLVTDPPEHTRLRRLVSRAFTPRAIEGLRNRIHEVVDELLRELEGRAECDLVAEYTSRIPIAIIAEMMGIPRDETDRLLEIAQATTKMIGTAAASWRDFRAATKVLREFDQYLAEHIERLRGGGAPDSILSDVIRHGDLSDVEVRMLAGLLLGAGFVTTTHVLGKGIVALAHHPDQLATLCANPEVWPNAIEEILRYDTTAQIMPRVATEDVDLHEYPVRAGDAMLLLVGGANRDPAVFENPDIFDVTRANAREHISFGIGMHACLGAALARMELHIGLQSLFERFPQLTLAGEPTFNDTIGLHGLKHLPVSLGAANILAS
ncbi:cytochrome P450 [Mycobacterium branderi]|uniref:Cytochrome n=1 Tax=Mycobacterium branderi TaxID=43348 RepID=A0A7I7W0N4_9MYCO|nr:cytochrome P450 [Mycobacterium branderi]MCV7235479.1 cytochrome P450 [Mycobacterium branderi]ORA34348.1 cytochrome [Mycobacterium branderi]BBZ11164.1 putative cytochrome P450 [Mycobacterium branderi]